MLFAALSASANALALAGLISGIGAAAVGIARYRPEADVALVGAATGFVAELRLELDKCRERIDALEAKEARREEEMRNLVQQLRRVEQERDALTRRVRDQETTIRDQAIRIDELEAQVDDLKRRGGAA